GNRGADLAGGSQAATTRVDQLREVERHLTAEVTRLAALAERTADRRALAYGGVFLLTARPAVVLLALARPLAWGGVFLPTAGAAAARRPPAPGRAREDPPDWTPRIREAVPDPARDGP